MSELTERLALIGIHTGRDFAEMGEAEAWITFSSYVPFYAVLYTGTPGRWDEKVINPTPGSHRNTAMSECLAIAQSVATGMGVAYRSWEHGPIPECWYPREARERVMGYLEIREKEGKR